jgi:hypothetical protein
MTARVLVLLRLFLARPGPAEPARARPTCRRRAARAAVGSGAAAFAAATVALAAALDTVRPEWRDPEFAVRLNHLRGWKAAAPGRPLAVAFGSSRTQMGLDPGAMGLPDGPTDPLVYNFGYRAAHPLGAWFQFRRVLEAGIKPDFVLVQVAAAELGVTGPAERQLRTWAARFTPGDIARLAAYTRDGSALPRQWVAAHLTPWTTYRGAIRSDLLPDWQTEAERRQFAWEQTDPYGFAPYHLEAIPEPQRDRVAREAEAKHARALAGRPLGETSMRSLREMVDRCRAEGIAVACFWAPESPTYRRLYSPEARAVAAGFERIAADEWGVTVFPAPDHLADDDFVDGYHLLRHGAAKYSRWLADTHLRAWFAAHGR